MTGGWWSPEVWRGALLALAAIAPLAALFAWLLRKARFPGGALSAALAGGLLAGVLLGPSVLGKAAPDAHDSLFVGGARERAALSEIESRMQREALVLGATGVTPDAVEEWRAAIERERAAAGDALTAALDSRHRGVLAAGLGAFALALATGGWRSRRHGPTHVGAAMNVLAGLGSFLFAALPAGAAVQWLGGASQTEAWTFGAACGVGGAWITHRARRLTAAARSRDVDAAALVACVLGLAAAIIAACSAPTASTGPAWSVAIGTCAVVGVLGRRARWAASPRRTRRAMLTLFHAWLAPIMAGALMVRLDLDQAASTTLLVGVIAGVVFAHDGRWIGAWAGFAALGGGATEGKRWRMAAATMDAEDGAMSVGIALLGLACGLLTPALALAVGLCAIVVEASAGARRGMSRVLDRMGAAEAP